MFQNHLRPNREYFTPTAIASSGQFLDYDIDDCMREVMLWHYKHTVAKCWGGNALQPFLKDFRIAKGDEVACTSYDVRDWEEWFIIPSTPPSSSSGL